jgi:hypothetical protein
VAGFGKALPEHVFINREKIVTCKMVSIVHPWMS